MNKEFNQTISIHAPARGATSILRCPNISYKFQSTLPRGERRGGAAMWDSDENDFNPRSREGSDTIIHVIMGGHILFQSTLPRGERRGIRCVRSLRCINFNPRSREGSDENRWEYIRFSAISIHAPARGATAEVVIYPQLLKFQSTLPRGERRIDWRAWISDAEISIHAPARGATRSQTCLRRSPRNFNPRSREGSDDERPEEVTDIKISIHAPARGATDPTSKLKRFFAISIHAPARGAT